MDLFDNLHLPVTDPTWIFFLVLLVILFAPMILGRLRIPHIIGMILAGIVVGEYGFNILEKDSSFELFGKVGLYYIMFLAGLEMDMDDFKKNRFKALIFGFFTFLIPMGLGIWSSMEFLGYNFTTSVLLASMYASHTLIAYPIISRYGLTRLRSVSITIGGTAITVTLALLVLAVIAGIYKDQVDRWFWIELGVKVVLVCTILIVFLPRICRWFFRMHEDNIMQFIFVLAAVFLGGGLFDLAGLEGILGAFLVGLILNRLIPHVSPLMNRLEFVGNALFIPYFLIGVGMIIDVRTLFTGGEALKVAVVMTVVATFSKWLAAWITQKSFRMQPEERSVMFGLSNAQAAATLAAVLIGNKIEASPGVPLLNDDVLNGTVVMILFTCIISSLATERAARKIVLMDNTEEVEDKPQEEENILIPMSNPDTIDYLINTALILKDPRRKEGLIALNVINDNNATEAKQIQGKRYLEKAAKIAASADVTLHTVTRFDLNIASGIIHTYREYNTSEVVIGLHRKTNIVDSFYGSKTESLLKGLHRQILIVRFLMPVNTMRRIIVAVPPKAEFEVGFTKWVERLCRMGSQIGCRVHFYATRQTMGRISGYINKYHKALRTDYTLMDSWDDLMNLSRQVDFEHLLVIVTARRGTISYHADFEDLPTLIGKYFSNNSLMVLYPDQYGDSDETITFSDPRGQSESPQYENVGRWFYKWFKKKE
ncbi:MAG: cation:proton antiporter [Bacteroides sp.]|nr:cation:proton antiporter [Bacteroides sp.]